MGNHGVVFGAGGVLTRAWAWYGGDACPFSMPVEAGGTVVYLDDTLTEAEVTAVITALTPTSVIGDLDPEIIGMVEDVIPTGAAPEIGEAMVYNPSVRQLISRSPAGIETLIHDFLNRRERSV